MKTVVFAAGGVGGYFGARLARAGHDVIFMARGQHLQAMKFGGLKINSIQGDFQLSSVQCTDNPTETGIVDLIIVAVKSWQLKEVGNAMRPMIGPDTIVLPLLNGVEAPDQLAQILGESHVLGGLCNIMSMIAGPGHIRHLGIEPYIAIGELDNTPTQRTRDILRILEQAGIKAAIPDSIRAAMWKKFLFICTFSGVGAITRAPIGVIRSLPETRGLLETSLTEIYQLARALDIPIHKNLIERSMGFFDALPVQGTASMQRDITKQRPSELEAQNGAVVRIAHSARVDVPLNNFIYASLLPRELTARGQLPGM